MKPRRYDVNGHSVDVRGMRVGNDVWLHADGEIWVIDQRPKIAKSKSGGKDGDKGGAILAPMPGKILKVNVKVGDKVQAKQVLIIMDAMKMEYSLAAPAAGVVKEIHVKEAQQVELEQLLATLVVEKL